MTISQKSAHQTHEAIVFFAGGAVCKEMLYTEFEALLDCVVPMREFTGKAMEAAYVRLDQGLAVVAAVLFIVNFDPQGFPEQSWNVPLRMLADAGVRGPDMGGGPVRLSTHSQCPMQGYAHLLWDIQHGPNGNTLELLRERLRGNRLGLDAVDVHPHAPPPLAQAWPTAAPVAMAPQGMPMHAPAQPAAVAPAPNQEAVLALMQQSNQQMAMLREQNQRETMALQQRLGEAQQRVLALENEKGVLLGQFNEQTQASEEEHRRAERTLQLAIERSRTQLASLRAELETERDARLAALASQHAEESAARDRVHAEESAARDRAHAEELAAREQQAAAALAERDERMQEERVRLGREREQQEAQLLNLRTELTGLRGDKLRLMGEGADKFFVSLKEKGVKFVAFQPGAGHLTIPMEDIYRYIEDTTRFVAEKCGVTEEHYRRWLAHYNNPVCQGSAGSGGPCAKPLTKLLKPAEFVAGMHDRCDIHKQVPRSQPRDKSA